MSSFAPTTARLPAACYRWNLVDARSNSIILPNLRLDSFAEAIGALRYWEYVPDVPTPGPGF